MRICPICQREYSDSIELCAREGAKLERYDLRADLRARRDREMFAPLISESLTARLGRELASAQEEFRRHPRLFILGLLGGDNDPHYRRSLGRSAALSLIAVNAFLSLLILALGAFGPASAKRQTEKEKPPVDDYIPVFTPARAEPAAPRRARGRDGRARGSRSAGERSGGGGGGGTNSAAPARSGGPVIPSLLPQIVAPRIDMARIEHASLIHPMTIYADPRAVPPSALPVGDPESAAARESGGPGSNGGLGSGRNGGQGSGSGPGIGPGSLGGIGGASFRPGRPGGDDPSGTGTGSVPWASARLRPTILYKEKARYTEDARLKQVQGTVVLRATFSADGEVTDIRVVRGLPDGLTEMAILAAQRIRFRPAMHDGVPVSVRASLEYNFVLY